MENPVGVKGLSTLDFSSDFDQRRSERFLMPPWISLLTLD